MKTLFGVVAILVSTPCAYAYIEESSIGRKSTPFSVTDWSPKSFAPKIRIRPLGEPAMREDKINIDAYTEDRSMGRKSSQFSVTDWSPKSFAPKIRIRPLGDIIGEPTMREDKINVDSNADNIIRREYSAWTKRHGKVKNVKRFEVFKRNFVLQMEMNRKNGEFFLLNEYGDLTEDEYASMLEKSKESERKVKSEIEAPNNDNLKVSAISSKALAAAPVKRLEDLTKEVLNSAMESSRKFVAENQEAVLRTENEKLAAKLAEAIAQPEKCLPQKIYASLLEATWKLTQEERETQNKNPTGVFQSNPLFASYIDLLYNPMQSMDDLILRPALLSAAITSSSQTIQNYLIEEIHPGWETFAYAINFDDSEC